MSESDQPLEPLRLGGDAVAGGGPDLGQLRRLAASDADAPVKVIGFEDFFAAAVLLEPRRGGGAERAGEDRIAKLRRALTDNLSGLRVYRVGSVSVAVYVLGTSAAGNLLGLSTRVVET